MWGVDVYRQTDGTDRQEHRWKLEIDGQVGQWSPNFFVALRQEFLPRNRKEPWTLSEITQS